MKQNNELNIRKVINANGKMTVIGVSTLDESVIKIMSEFSKKFVIMDELKNEVDKIISNLFDYEDSYIVNSASAGIALSTAAVIYNDKVNDVNKNIPERCEIIIQSGHCIDYGAPIIDIISLVGAKVKSIGTNKSCTIEDVRKGITKNTAALFYVVSHYCVQENIVSLKEMNEIAIEFNLPLIVDCAAEEEIEKFNVLDNAAIIFSGSKAIEGPTSGIVFGNASILTNIKKHSNIIGRVMKIGKENIAGVFQALINYKNKVKKEINYDSFIALFEQNDFYMFELKKDLVRDFKRIQLTFNPKLKKHTKNIIDRLHQFDPSIYTRNYLWEDGIIEIDLRATNISEVKIIKNTLNKICKELT